MPIHHFDLVVIGSGPGGEKAAVHAAQLGRKVAVVEKESVLGGTVANQGALPSKTLREAALCLTLFRQRGIHGVNLLLDDTLSIQEFLYRERLVRQLEQARIRAQLESSRVTLYHGRASFLDAHTIGVKSAGEPGSQETLSGEVVLIATGAGPSKPEFLPSTHPAIFNSQNILELSVNPKTLTIAGAGAIGSEYACIFAALGVQVTLLDENPKLLSFLDKDVSTALAGSMRSMGIDLRLEEKITGCQTGAMPVVTLSSGRSLSTEALLITTKRRGNTDDLNLEAAEVEVDSLGFIPVNEHFQTLQQHIYAAGDVVGFPGLASAARDQAMRAITHAFAPQQDQKPTSVQPYGIYTIPECALAGDTEDVLTGKDIPWISGIAHYAGNPRGQIMGARAGFLKLLFHRETLQLLGVHMIGEQAAELIHYGSLAIQTKATANLLLSASYNYPTLTDLYRQASLDALAKRNPTGRSPSSILRPK